VGSQASVNTRQRRGQVGFHQGIVIHVQFGGRLGPDNGLSKKEGRADQANEG
jgi:hypothetical protein